MFKIVRNSRKFVASLVASRSDNRNNDSSLLPFHAVFQALSLTENGVRFSGGKERGNERTAENDKEGHKKRETRGRTSWCGTV